MESKSIFGLGLENSYFKFPLVSTFSINDTSNVSEFPLVNRLQIIDHKYDNPRTISITTTISNHNNIKTFPDIENNSIVYKNLSRKDDYIIKINEFFTKLKRESWLVTIFSPSNRIKNTILDSISWNDNGQWAEVTLSFKEIYTYVIEEVTKKVNPGDKNLPNITDIVPQNFVQSVLLRNSFELDMVILNSLRESGFIEDKFLRALQYSGIVFGTTIAVGLLLIGIAGLVAVGVKLIGSVIAGTATLAAVTGPIGWIAIGVAALGAIIGLGIWALVRFFQRQERKRLYYDDFRYYVNKSDQEKEEKRFSKTIKSIYDGVGRLNNVIKSYKLPSNVKQELNITLNNENYQLIFTTRDNNNDKWYVTLKDYADNVVEVGDKKIDQVLVDPLLSYFSATNENYVIKVGDDKVHFTYDTKYLSDIVITDEKKRIIPGKKKKVNLERLQINVTSQDLDEFKENIKKITLTAMRRKGV